MKYHIIRPDEIVALKGLTAHFAIATSEMEAGELADYSGKVGDVLEITSSNGAVWEDGKCASKKLIADSRLRDKIGQKRPSTHGQSMSDLRWSDRQAYDEQYSWNNTYYGIFGTFLLKEAARYGGNYVSDIHAKYMRFGKIQPRKIITLNKFYGQGLVGTQGVCFEKSVIIGIVKPLPSADENEVAIVTKVSEFLQVPLVTLAECREAMAKVMKAHSLPSYKMKRTESNDLRRMGWYSDVRKVFFNYDDTITQSIKEEYGYENR